MVRTDGLREVVEAMDREMSRLVARTGGAGGGDEAALVTSWAKLVEFLALGPAPELRTCPFCGSVGMRAATRCGACWRKLPAAPPANGAHLRRAEPAPGPGAVRGGTPCA
jgi:hypothetical protein